MAGRKDRSFFDKMKEMDDGSISDDDLVEEGDRKTWFARGMSCDEKIEACQPWCNSVIVKVVGRPVGYHYL